MTDEELDVALGLAQLVAEARAARERSTRRALAALEADPYHDRVAVFEFGADVSCTIALRGLGVWQFRIEAQRCCVPAIAQAIEVVH